MTKPSWSRIGPYSLHSIETGTFALDGGAMFGIVPKVIWEKEIKPDDKNRIPMHARALLVRGPNLNLLIDCGMGSKWSEKHRDIYAITDADHALHRSLNEVGLKTSDITHLVLTHLHFDHAGGSTFRDAQANLLPSFENARVFVQQRNWDLAWKPNEKDRASYLAENYSVYRDEPHLSRKLERLTTPAGKSDTIAPGITVEVSDGHTLGMQIVRIFDPTRPEHAVTYGADLVPTSSHVRTAFIMGYDCYPIQILAEKKLLLNRLADEGSWLFYEHCPHLAASQVLRTPKGDFEAVRA